MFKHIFTSCGNVLNSVQLWYGKSRYPPLHYLPDTAESKKCVHDTAFTLWYIFLLTPLATCIHIGKIFAQGLLVYLAT